MRTTVKANIASRWNPYLTSPDIWFDLMSVKPRMLTHEVGSQYNENAIKPTDCTIFWFSSKC